MAPKRKVINYDKVKNYRQIMATEKEIAEMVGFSYRGFQERKKVDDELQKALGKGEVEGKLSLRQAMFSKAMGGNFPAQKWLSQNVLGYKDKVETTEGLGGGILVVPQRVADPIEWLKNQQEEGDTTAQIVEFDESEA